MKTTIIYKSNGVRIYIGPPKYTKTQINKMLQRKLKALHKSLTKRGNWEGVLYD